MLKQLIHSIHPSIEKFQEILLNPKFDQRAAEKMLPKINKNYKFDGGDTLLDISLRKNRFKAASWLVRQGIDITTRNKDNISTVRLAIEKGNIVVIDTIAKFSDFYIDQVDQNGRSLLQDAVILGHNEISKILLDKKINVNIQDKYDRNVIFDAVNYGDPEILDTILEVKDLEMNFVDKTGKTVLHQKPIIENDDLALKLLDKGADPTICDPVGYNFITRTALRGEAGQKVLDAAIKASSNLNAKLANHNTVLMEVMQVFAKIPKVEIDRRNELKNVANKLITNGSDLNSVNKYGETMIFEMIRKGDMEGLAFILDHKIDVNQKNSNGETPLQVAVLKGVKFMDMVLLLLQKGADPTIKNKYEQTIPEFLNDIILYVYKFKNLENSEYASGVDFDGQYMLILREILQSKFDFSYFDSQGDPLFFGPFLYGDIKTTQVYLQNGFNINTKNKDGHNLYYEYVLKCFEAGEYFKEFRDNLVFLLVNKTDIRVKNKDGQIIFSKVALLPNCNLKLFRKLAEVAKHDYEAVDNMGRTIIHNCVMSNNLEVLKWVFGVVRNIQNIPDSFNMLPVTYAALMGRSEIVELLLNKDTKVTSGKSIPDKVKQKFRTMLGNMAKMTDGIEEPILLRQMEILKQQIVKDLK